MILPDLAAHAETECDHVVLLTVPWAAALNVIQQGCLKGPTLHVRGQGRGGCKGNIQITFLPLVILVRTIHLGEHNSSHLHAEQVFVSRNGVSQPSFGEG